MTKIDKNELYQNLRSFLKSKGVSLEEGSYARRLEQGCHLLAETINTTQATVEHAKVRVDRALNQLRHTIHQATAPKAGPGPSASSRPPAGGPKSGTKTRKRPASGPRKKRR
jgi:hypothetical protein